MNIISKIKRKISYLNKNRLIHKYNGKLFFDTKNAIVISGMPRGGSTWLAELLATDSKSAIIWEPLHLDFFPQFKKLHFKWRQYINDGDTDLSKKKIFEEVLTGKALTLGILQRTSIKQLLSAEFLLIKFCRANRLLPWLTHNFEFKKTIHLLRHPCAVVASQLRFGAWNDVEAFFTDEELAPDGFIENYYDIIKSINNIEEKLTAIWCLDNIIPLTQNTRQKWVSVTYENMLLHPEKSFERMGLEFTEAIKNKFYKPSTTTKSGSPINQKEDSLKQLSYWKNSLSESQINVILGTLKKFKIEVYNKEIYPTVDF